MKHLIDSTSIDAVNGPFKMHEFTGRKGIQPADVTPLCAQLALQPKLWNQHPIAPESKVDSIIVRYNAWKHFNPKKPEKFHAEHDSTWYPAYDKLPAVRPLIFGLMNLVAGERLGSCLITRIPAGSSIGRHKDSSWHAGYYNRKFAVMLASNYQQAFCCDGESMLTEPGEVFEFDSTHENWVRNDSADPRLTLIVCLRTTGDRAGETRDPGVGQLRRKPRGNKAVGPALRVRLVAPEKG